MAALREVGEGRGPANGATGLPVPSVPRRRRAKVSPGIPRVVQMAIDAGLVLVAFWLAHALRYRAELGGDVPEAFVQPFSAFADKAALLVLAALAIFTVRGLYRLPRWTSLVDESSIIASGATTAMAIVILYSFLLRFSPSRLIFIYAWALMIALLIGERLLGRWLKAQLWARGIGVDRVLVVGAGPAGQRIMQYLYNHPRLGYRVIGFADVQAPAEELALATERRVVHPPYLGDLSQVTEIVRSAQVDEVIVALPPAHHDQILEIVEQCRELDVAFSLVPDLFELALDRVQISEVAGLPLIGIKEGQIRGWNYGIKRAMDIVISLTVLILAAPLMALIALAIKLDSPGPILFRQVRVGKGGRHFILYKFRSMVDGAEQQQPVLQEVYGRGALLFKLRDDPRVTRVGRFLRRTSLDELPQFFNVLKGEMSVVGPRPPVPAEVAEYQDWHLQRLMVTPGLTGLWQVNGRSDLSFDEMVRLDLYYAEHWSPWLDIKLMLRTVPVILTGRGAY
ncbi:UDP-glucose:undecaprenyl-phosphate glucose-1-phosphate transferase [bacterium HR26]|nr:UDP-glucose:undecaprenyl-phosphate glucose-1-phosphate transferase [bacterium HR26]